MVFPLVSIAISTIMGSFFMTDVADISLDMFATVLSQCNKGRNVGQTGKECEDSAV